MPRQRTAEWEDAASHPIAWFSALSRRIDRNDRPLIDQTLDELAKLGFQIKLSNPRPEATNRKVVTS